jgi:hypothetical protein
LFQGNAYFPTSSSIDDDVTRAVLWWTIASQDPQTRPIPV